MIGYICATAFGLFPMVTQPPQLFQGTKLKVNPEQAIGNVFMLSYWQY